MKTVKSICLLILLVIVSMEFLPIFSAEAPLFLLGKNGKGEIVMDGKVSSQFPIDKNPLGIVTNGRGRKILLCAGEFEPKDNELKSKASVRLFSENYLNFAQSIELDSAIRGFAVSADNTVLWITTSGGLMNKEVVKPKLVRIDLDSFKVATATLSGLPVILEVSADDRMVAVASFASFDSPSTMTVFDAISMQLLFQQDIAYNPALIMFSPDNTTAIVACYGSRSKFPFPVEIYQKTKGNTPATIYQINLVTKSIQSKAECDPLAKDFVTGESMVYAAVKIEEEKGLLFGAGFDGQIYQRKLTFSPEVIQEQPSANRVLVMGGLKAAVFTKYEGNLLAEFALPEGADPIIFIRNSPFGYMYNINSGKLSIIDLNQSKVAAIQGVGRTGRAAFKKVLAVLSVIDYAAGPRYADTGSGSRICIYRPMPPNWRWLRVPSGNVLVSPDEKKLYFLSPASNDVAVLGVSTNQFIKNIKGISNSAQYLQLTPNKRFIVVVTTDNWKLIDLIKDEDVLTMEVNSILGSPILRTPFYSPDGNRLYIPGGLSIMVVDLVNGIKLDSIETETRNALVNW